MGERRQRLADRRHPEHDGERRTEQCGHCERQRLGGPEDDDQRRDRRQTLPLRRQRVKGDDEQQQEEGGTEDQSHPPPGGVEAGLCRLGRLHVGTGTVSHPSSLHGARRDILGLICSRGGSLSGAPTPRKRGQKMHSGLMLALLGPVGPMELLIILAIVILIFGANRLSGLGKGLGQADSRLQGRGSHRRRRRSRRRRRHGPHPGRPTDTAPHAS